MSTTVHSHGEVSQIAMSKISHLPVTSSVVVREKKVRQSRKQQFSRYIEDSYSCAKEKLKDRPDLVRMVCGLHRGTPVDEHMQSEAWEHVKDCKWCLSWAVAHLPSSKEIVNARHWASR